VKPDDARLRLSFGEALLGATQFADACAQFAQSCSQILFGLDVGAETEPRASHK